MGAVGFAFRAELHRRWRSWLVVVLLISLVSGLVLAAIVAGRRTASAFPQFVATYGEDATVYSTHALPQLKSLPGVSSATPLVGPDNGQPTCRCTHPINIASSNFTVFAPPPAGPPLWKLESGRLPDPRRANEVLASYSLEQDNGVKVGTVIRVPFFAPSQAAAANSISGTPPTPRGPTVFFHVVGIAVSEFDFPSGNSPPYELFTTPAFTRDILPRTLAGVEYAVRLRDGAAGLARFNAETEKLGRDGLEGVANNNGLVASVEGSIHPQAVGWWILAALAALVGLAVIGQAIVRQTTLESEDYPTLVALGADQRQLVLLGMARNAAIGMLGALGALVVALALSPLTPVGEARLAVASHGVHVDGPVFWLGGLSIVVVVLLLGLWPAIRVAQTRRSADRNADIRPSAVVGRLAAVGAAPSILIGTRNALQRRRDGSAVPLRTALLGTVLAVVALSGTLVFGASLSHLTATPSLYGDRYQLSFEVIPGYPDPSLAPHLERDRDIRQVTRGIATQVSIGGSPVGVIAVQDLRGPTLLSTIDGHPPNGIGQIGLGAATMRQVGAHIGSTVKVTVATPSGGSRIAPFTVVSDVPLPVLDGFVGLGNGAVLTVAGYEAVACPAGAGQMACRQEFEEGSLGGYLTSMVSGPRGRADVLRYLRVDPSIAVLPIVPTSLVNFGEAINFPLIFGLIVAIFGAATLAHLLVVSVARRRRETGLLKVLGFVNSQVMSAVSWQSTIVALIGVVVGIPLGIIAGRAAWSWFADHIGVVGVPVVPAGLMIALAFGVIVMANLIAIGPAWLATRVTPGRLLRTQ